MTHGKLSDHRFHKGKFIAPWNEFADGLLRENSWYYGRLPDYLWLALIVNNYGKNLGLQKCNIILKKLHKVIPDLTLPQFSRIIESDPKTQQELYEYIANVLEIEVLAPLTAIFTYSKYPSFASMFQSDLSVDDRMAQINSVLKETSDHQAYLSTDVRFLVLYFNILSGKLHMPREMLELLMEYPELSHDHEKMKMIRPTVRAMELAPTEVNPYNTDYLNQFWEGVSRMSDCNLYYVNFEQESHDTEEYMIWVKSILQYYTDLLTSANPLDSKMLVLLGIATYSYKRLDELVEHKLFHTIAGRSIVRVLIEDLIMMKYLLQNEVGHEDIWTEYQYYGIGQYKLIVERYKQSGNTLPESHVAYDYMDLLVSEYKNKDFIDMDTTYFDKQNIRGKAISVNEKGLFDFYYDYDSAFEHGLWGAIRESSLLKCNTPAHQYHCVPDLENKQKMKSVWNDCIVIIRKTISVLEEVYGLPLHLSKGAQDNGL